jgi:hypothetical protein
VPGCDLSNWCLHPFGGTCSSGSSGSEGGTGVSGVNVSDCMVGDNPDFPGRAYTVWATFGDGWLNAGQISTMATGQVCTDPSVVGNKTSISFSGAPQSKWTVRLVKVRLTDSDGCDSSVPDGSGCSLANDDFLDTPFQADDASPMGTLTLAKDF